MHHRTVTSHGTALRGNPVCMGHASNNLFWRHETSRNLLRAQLTRPLLGTRTSVTAGLGWNIIQVGTSTVRSRGNSCVCSGIGGDGGWVIASLHLLESPSPLNEWRTTRVLPWRLSEAYQ